MGEERQAAGHLSLKADWKRAYDKNLRELSETHVTPSHKQFHFPQRSRAGATLPETSGHSTQGGKQAAGPQPSRAQGLQGKLQAGTLLLQFPGLWLQPPAMLHLASGTRGSSQDLLTAGPSPPGGWSCLCQGCGWRVQDEPGAPLKLRASSTVCPGATKIRVSLNPESLFPSHLEDFSTKQLL